MMTQLRQHKDIIFATKENLNNNIHNYFIVSGPGAFVKDLGNLTDSKSCSVFIQDGVFKSFEKYTLKLLAKETK